MDRYNIPIPPDEDFPEVVVAQRIGEGFKKEYVEYEPQWRFDKRRRAVVVDEKCFYAMADTSERLTAENDKLRRLLEGIARGTYREMCTYRDESGCKGCSMRDGDKTCLIADASQLLGIEVVW